jgi:hypothetical protein
VLTVARDITERKRAEARQAQLIEEPRGRFASAGSDKTA